jgi:hypothetical protein
VTAHVITFQKGDAGDALRLSRERRGEEAAGQRAEKRASVQTRLPGWRVV